MASTLVDGTHRLILADGRRAFAKLRGDAPAGFFESEARGLAALRRVDALRVPAVYAVDAHRIVLEDLGSGERAPDYWQRAGAGLARQHSVMGAHFGFEHDGFCGDSRQDNTTDDDGWRFFSERRLLPQTRYARDRGLIEARDGARLEHLSTTLREHIPDLPPVLLHGDLWSGNLHVCGDGLPALIDAGAAHYGWAEAELAMLTLFGPPPDEFFLAYAERATLRPDWRKRVSIYNLYHLLNHVNLFGTSYLTSLRSALGVCM